ncbi:MULTISPECIES: DUF2892 domain-containing protein [Thioclava]|uniref:YgaP family membrane protein n=1 Tax=Thioclava TaxID=285107 RepID=UPI0009978B0A|nr:MULTISPECIES: DUF2892 domain-containing protein [Thioclava]MAQ37610.1 DUF2892 domain-containing protein [Thioclava sp.]MPQ93500.1 DUF2892 domain-containing protein [Thioclava sp. JE_KL1]OOY17594.1 hypothetical protein BMI85_01125 [Thioclava sp. DLFJ4-1]|tara:strand:- start:1111 stop:1308 length:198 start_codon:yes stop_codon:yes gene_type:complete
MFKNNVGGIDRTLRIVVGLALIIGFFVTPPGPYHWLYWIGLIPLATGLLGTCPLYSMLGVNTCQK